MCRYVSADKASDLILAEIIIPRGDHCVEMRPGALDQTFPGTALRYDTTESTKGWDVRPSGGVCVWQMVEGGRYQPA